MSEQVNLFEFFIKAESIGDDGVNKYLFIPLAQIRIFTDDTIIFSNDSKLSVSNVQLLNLYDVKRCLEIQNDKNKQHKATLK